MSSLETFQREQAQRKRNGKILILIMILLWGLYLVTNPWDPKCGPNEVAAHGRVQGGNPITLCIPK